MSNDKNAVAGAEDLGHAVKVPRVGVALFSNPKDVENSTGWYCASDGEPCWFTNLVDLPPEVLWIVDVESDRFWQFAKTHSNLRSTEFFRSKLRQIAADIGVRVNGDFHMEASRELARVAQSAVCVATSVYQWKNPLISLGEGSLRACIAESIPKPPHAKHTQQEALASAVQNYSQVPWSGMSLMMDSVVVPLRFNRVEYANRLLSIKVPDEGWTYVGDASKIALDDFLTRPCLVRVLIEFNHPNTDLVTLAAFGCGLGKSKQVIRQWVSQPELVWLSKLARIQVQDAFISKSERDLPDDAKLPRMLTADPLFAHSISAGLVAESHWAALAAPVYGKSKKTEYTCWGVWLRAHDRAMCFALAEKLLAERFHVTGYGNGSVNVKVQRSDLIRLMDFSVQEGLAGPCFRPILIENGVLPMDD